MFEGWTPGGKSEIGVSDSGPATELEKLESRRDALKMWMRRNATPDDVRLLDDLNRQIQVLEEQPRIQE